MRGVHILTVGVAVLALAACGDKNQAEKAGGAPSAGSSAAPGVPNAPQTTPRATPKLRAGLWRVTTSGDGPEGVARMCLDDAVQDRLNVVGAQASAGACQQTTMTPNPGGGWRYRSVCDHTALGGGTSVSEGVMTGDLTRSYSSRTTVTTTGAQVAHMNRAVTITGEGVYEGPCSADMKPGDMTIPGGMTFNMLEMAEMASKMEAPRAAR